MVTLSCTKTQTMTIPYQLINLGLGLISLPGRTALARASRNPEKASAKTLRKILLLAKDTVYGKEHHFASILKARKPEQLFRLFEKSVRPSDYESFRAYVDRHKKGEPNVLIPGKPLMYATTSGTTSQPKWIPISSTYMKTSMMRCHTYGLTISLAYGQNSFQGVW